MHTSRYPIFPFFSHTPKMPHSYSWRDVLSKAKASITVPSPPSDLAWLLLLSPTFSSPTPLTLLVHKPHSLGYRQPICHLSPCSIHIHLKNPSKFPNQPQYPISQKHQQGLKPIITKLHQGLLLPSHSPYNTPVLPIKKPHGSYCLLQDLKVISEAVIPIHPVVPNPYTLLSFPLPLPTSLFYTSKMPSLPSLYTQTLKTSCLYLDQARQSSLPTTDRASPQVFRDSPHFFGQALASDLTSLYLTLSTVLQYVDDLLCSPSLTHSQQHTIQLLNFLANRGYRVSPTKVQLSLPRVTYLRVLLLPTKRYITTDRKSLISTLPLPPSKAEMLSFLGLAGYLRLWIPNFTLLA